MVEADADDGAQLLGEQFGLFEAEADAAAAEERVGFGAAGQVWKVLVAADVERPDGEPAAIEGVGDGQVAGELFVLAGRVAPVEEEELGAQQPDAVGTVADRRADVVGRGDVGGDLDADTVGRDGDASRCLLQRLVATPRLGARPTYSRTVSGGGSNSTTPAEPSTTTVVPSVTAKASPPAPTTIGIPSERARIAPCETGLPKAVTTAVTRSGSSAAASIGLRSAATRTPSTLSNDAASAPFSCAATCWPTASTSLARAR